MPCYRCQKCGAKYYGWSDKLTCECGGDLIAVKEEEWEGIKS